VVSPSLLPLPLVTLVPTERRHSPWLASAAGPVLGMWEADVGKLAL
jgi:hypothetical protein